MDARQCRSRICADEVSRTHRLQFPPSARPEAFDQSYGSANYNVQ